MYDFCIIGGGIVGLSAAFNLVKKFPQASILLLEKEKRVGSHQTSHNSGVVHAGIYYEPESLKAKLCLKGLRATEQFCVENELDFLKTGKYIVATNADEHNRLKALYSRAVANGSKVSILNGIELNNAEPNINGVAAIFSPNTAITNYGAIAIKLASLLSSKINLLLDAEVTAIKEKVDHVSISTLSSSYKAKKLISCAGLASDRIATLAGLNTGVKIIPFKGEYFYLPTTKNHIVNSLIYPVPDPRMPFLGVHLTKMIDGRVTVGPNAVFSLSREGYKKFSFNLRDASSSLSYSGFWRLLYRYRDFVFKEFINSFSKTAYLQECRKFCPSLELGDFEPYPAGIRAQVVNKNGQPEHDFLILKSSRMVHLINAPSPAATSAFPIGELVVNSL